MTASSAPARRSFRGRTFVLALVSTLAATLLGALVVPMIIRPGVTAETRLVVGIQSRGAQTVPGYAQATVTLAETDARFITMDTVNKSQSPTLTDVQATAIPSNPVIRIQASAGNAKDARSGAAAAAQALIKSVNQVSSTTVDKTRQIYLTKRAADVSAQANDQLLQAEIAANPNPSDQLKSAYQAAVTAAALTALESDTYDNILRSQLQAGADQSTGLTVIMAPQVTSTTKNPMLLGALLGGALAVLGWGSASIIREARRREQASPSD